jgi:hypothetical protein
MPPLSSDHPDPKHIIDTIAEAMQAGVLPFDDEFSLVPNIYQVVLHPDVFRELERVFPTIEARSKVRLDRELTRMNASSGKGVHHQIMDGLKGLLKIDKPDTSPGIPAQDRYKRGGSGWEILFTQALTSPFDVSEVLVEAVLDTTRNNNLAGSKTVKLIVRGADGSFSDQTPSGDGVSPSPASPPTQRSEVGAQATSAPTSPSPSGETIARLSFKDDKGPQTFMMTQQEISVGRGGEGAKVDLLVHTLPDVSRHHLSLRYDPDTNTFLIKDLSTYGTTVDGRTVASSRSADGDQNYWERLQNETTIGLAGVLFIDFKSMT